MIALFFFSSRRRHTRSLCDWSSDVCSSDLTCVDAASLEVKATIALEGKPELAVESPDKGLVYVNLEDKSSVCAIDAKAHKALRSEERRVGNECRSREAPDRYIIIKVSDVDR